MQCVRNMRGEVRGVLEPCGPYPEKQVLLDHSVYLCDEFDVSDCVYNRHIILCQDHSNSLAITHPHRLPSLVYVAAPKYRLRDICTHMHTPLLEQHPDPWPMKH